MTGSNTLEILENEIKELEQLLLQVKLDGNIRDLKNLLEYKQRALKRESETSQLAPEPTKLNVAPVPSTKTMNDDVVFTEISRFGWEDEGYGKPNVSVYILSGVDGVGSLPSENITCQFTRNSFDLKIMNLNGKNYRLYKNHLDKEINPETSSYRVKKNRVTLTLKKADKNGTWMNLTEKNPGKGLSKAGKSDDPAAGIMDMMKNMYEEGDDNMKRTIAQAWTESRNKQAAGKSMLDDMDMKM